MTAAPTLLAGRYRLGELVGGGGMGRVWLARDEILDRDVAVKEIILPDELIAAERDAVRRRTLREARAAARLSHPNVVQVYDVLETDDGTWIVMEYVPSQSLHQVLRAQGPVSPHRAAQIGLQVLAALRAAHRAEVWHRDVKPANVLIGEDDRVVLTDFGIATIEGDGNLTGSGPVLGSPEYMSPERARDGTAGAASDLWSLGATLYAAVEGRSPYRRGSTMGTLTALAADEPDPPQRAGVLQPVLEGLLVKDPAARIDLAETERRLWAAVNGEQTPQRRWPWSAGRTPEPSDAAAAVAPAAPAIPTQRAPEQSGPVHAAGRARVVEGPVGQASAATPPSPPAPTAAPATAATSAPTAAPSAGDSPPPATGAALDPEDDDPGPAQPAPAARRSRRRALIAACVVLLAAAMTLLLMRSGTETSAGTAPRRSTAPAGVAVPPDPAATGASAAATDDPAAAPTSGLTSGASGAPGASAAVGVPGADQDDDDGDDQGGSTGNGQDDAVAQRPALPAGWRDYRDSTGFRVYVPAGWNRSRKGTIVYFRDPKGGRVLGIDQTDEPKSDPVADWESQSSYRVRRGDFPGYREIRIAAVPDYFDKAADWEYTFNGGVRQHVNNRGIVVSSSKAYGIYWQTSDAAWADARTDLQLVFDSFRPAGY